MLFARQWCPHVAALMFCAAACAEQQKPGSVPEIGVQGSTALQLDEIATLSLPDSFMLAGASGSDRGVVLWAANQSFVLVHSSQPLRSVATGAPPIHAAWNDDGTVSVISTTALERMSMDGRRELIATIDKSGSLVDAVDAPDGWLVGRIQSGRTYEILKVARNGAARPHYHLSAADLRLAPEETAFVAPVRMRSTGDGVVLSLVKPPHTNFLLDVAGRRKFAFAPPERTSPPRAGERPSSWAAMPPVQLDCGFIQVISDLTSDDRRLVLYDLHGRMIRETQVDAPIGFVYADVAKQHLMAVRNAQSAELVTYEWQWAHGPTTRGGKACSRTE